MTDVNDMTENAASYFLESLPADPDAYDVVGAFAAAQDARPDDHTLLRQWTERFPQFADDLIAFGYARATLGWSLTDPIAGEADQMAPVKAPLSDLMTEARSRGLSPAEFTQAVRLDRPILASLSQRLLDAASLPRGLAARIGAALGRSADEIAAYFRQPPRLATGAHYKAKRAPALVAEARPRQTFAEALRSAKGLSEEDRAYWQAEIEKNEVLGDE